VELLLQSGTEVFEGAPELGGATSDKGSVFATVMLTIDLRKSAAAYRERPDAATASRVAELLADHPDLRSKLTERVRSPVAQMLRVSEQSVAIALDVSVRAQGPSILIDADVTGSILER